MWQLKMINRTNHNLQAIMTGVQTKKVEFERISPWPLINKGAEGLNKKM